MGEEGQDLRSTEPSLASGIVMVGLVAAALFGLRLLGPPDVMDFAQRRQAAYVMDAVQNGNWIVQTDEWGEVTSKPPMYTWLAGAVSYVTGEVTRLTLALPAGVATLLAAWVVLLAGRAWFGVWAGFFAAFAYLVSPMVAKQIALVRTDALFVLMILLAALAAFRAWDRGRGWTWFWLAAAAATLTKGPLGVVLAAGGLLAVVWESRRSQEPGTRRQKAEGRSEAARVGNQNGSGAVGSPAAGFRLLASGSRSLLRSHLPGVTLFLLITGGWFILAYLQLERSLIDKMIGDELVGKAISSGKGNSLTEGFYKPAGFFIARFAPWSILACLGIWRIFTAPSTDPRQRRFERFLCCWFLLGLAVFSLAAHQRGDLLMPLLPAAALLAGRELAHLVRPLGRPVVFAGQAAVLLVMLGSVWWYHAGHRADKGRVVQTMGMEEFARDLTGEAGRAVPLTYVDGPFALQFYLGRIKQRISYEEAAEMLAGEAAAFVVLSDPARLADLLAEGVSPHEVARWDGPDEQVVVVSNHPRLEWTEHMAVWSGPLRVEWEGLRLMRLSERKVVFSAPNGGGRAMLHNASEEARHLRVRVKRTSGAQEEQVLLEGGESWQTGLATLAAGKGAE